MFLPEDTPWIDELQREAGEALRARFLASQKKVICSRCGAELPDTNGAPVICEGWYLDDQNKRTPCKLMTQSTAQ